MKGSSFTTGHEPLERTKQLITLMVKAKSPKVCPEICRKHREWKKSTRICQVGISYFSDFESISCRQITNHFTAILQYPPYIQLFLSRSSVKRHEKQLRGRMISYLCINSLVTLHLGVRVQGRTVVWGGVQLHQQRHLMRGISCNGNDWSSECFCN